MNIIREIFNHFFIYWSFERVFKILALTKLRLKVFDKTLFSELTRENLFKGMDAIFRILGQVSERKIPKSEKFS